jgi:SPW repeat
MNEWTNAKLCDVANLILGAILFFSPWIFAFAPQNAYISGIVIAALAIAALAAFAVSATGSLPPILVSPPRTLQGAAVPKRCCPSVLGKC